MRVVLFGASGMVGQGVLLECLRDPGVESVITVVRKPTDPMPATFPHQQKVREIVHPDFQDFSSIKAQLTGLDACFFCLGVASAGMSEEDYSRVTYGITAAAARTLVQASPETTFIFVSGAGTDSSEKGRVMWARVKGKAENVVLGRGFKAAYIFRPGFIEALDGIESRTPLYRRLYKVFTPILPLLRRLLRGRMTSTQQIGRAMLSVARNGYKKPILEAADLTTF
ncbi:MAG: NAD(P)H-binding protein [Candidatus Acidiferrales bacterium]